MSELMQILLPPSRSKTTMRVPNEVAENTEEAMRQLRHQTKNTLQRVICLLRQAMPDMAHAGGLVEDLEHRICLSSRIADALFGFTRAPGPLPDQLEELCRALVELLGGPSQRIELICDVETKTSVETSTIILRIAHELVSNAIKHGMHDRLRGRITVAVERVPNGRLRLTVRDNGWGFGERHDENEGLYLVRKLISARRGTLSYAGLTQGSCLKVEFDGV